MMRTKRLLATILILSILFCTFGITVAAVQFVENSKLDDLSNNKDLIPIAATSCS